MKSTQKDLVLCKRENWSSGFRVNLDLHEDTILLDVKRHTTGLICLPAIDSGRSGFSWKRIQIACQLPEGSSLRVYAYASDSKCWGQWSDLDLALSALKAGDSYTAGFLRELYGEAVGRSEDFLAKRTGRYLWLMLELMSSGAENPVIEGITVWMDGDHMTEYLPAIYQGDDFTERFLSVFNSMFLDMEERINDLPRLLDSAETDEDMLRTLASWVCLDPEWSSVENLRREIPTALDDYEDMYTVEGIKRSVKRLTGRDAIVIEHHTADPNAPSCINPAVNRALYGEDPFTFFVLLEEDTFPSRDRMEDFLEQMELLIPAGMKLKLVLLKKCIQLDWHTYLGINSTVSSYSPAAIDENTTIHFDTMIGGDDSERL